MDAQDRAVRNFRALRAERNLTLKELADALGGVGYPLDFRTLSKIETGSRRLSVNDLEALALVFEVPVASLLDEPLGRDADVLVDQLLALGSHVNDLLQIEAADAALEARRIGVWLAIEDRLGDLHQMLADPEQDAAPGRLTAFLRRRFSPAVAGRAAEILFSAPSDDPVTEEG